MGRTNQAKRKRHKLRNAEHIINPSPDRLSSLPDSLLCHILSFLPTKVSGATSILAKRWRFLWAEVPNLEFDCGSNGAEYEEPLRFPTVIKRVMSLHKVRNINKFRLSCKEDCQLNDDEYDEYELNTWIEDAIDRNVQDIDIHTRYLTYLPSIIFTCRTLVNLRIHASTGVCLYNPVCLPSLKKLHLHAVTFWFDEALPHLLSGCPVLEELIIERLHVHRMRRCEISSPTLKWLALDLVSNVDYYDDDYRSEFELNTPALRYLLVKDYADNCFKHISVGSLDSLVQADIELMKGAMHKDDRFHAKNKDDRYPRSVVEFVERLCQVKFLKLWNGYMNFLDSSFADATARFLNLTKLELAADWRFLVKFLENADNLEVLIIGEVSEDLKCWMEPQQVPVCLSSHLRQVVIDPFACLHNEFQMVSYILKNAKVLNVMEIHAKYPGYGSEEKSGALQRISQYKRGSGACKVAVFETVVDPPDPLEMYRLFMRR